MASHTPRLSMGWFPKKMFHYYLTHNNVFQGFAEHWSWIRWKQCGHSYLYTLQFDNMLYTPWVVISKSGRDGYNEIPLCGTVMLSSNANTDLKWSFEVLAFSAGSVIIWLLVGSFKVLTLVCSCLGLLCNAIKVSYCWGRKSYLSGKSYVET